MVIAIYGLWLYHIWKLFIVLHIRVYKNVKTRLKLSGAYLLMHIMFTHAYQLAEECHHTIQKYHHIIQRQTLPMNQVEIK